MNNDIYIQHFGFRERPFTLLPDPDFLFWSKSHTRAFAALEYGIMSMAPLTVITGEIGAGKTTLIHQLIKSLDDTTVIGLISNAQGGRGELLRWVINALGIAHNPSDDYVTLNQILQDFAVEQYSQGRHIMLIIDEAQNLSVELLEELRLLTNINSNKDELIQLILVGQPELREMIKLPELRQFAQRVALAYHLDAMDIVTTSKYIRHRLIHAGGSGTEFAPETIGRIYEETGGIPRLVNKLCDLALVYAAGDGALQVTSTTITELINDQLFFNPKRRSPLVLSSNYLLRETAAE